MFVFNSSWLEELEVKDCVVIFYFVADMARSTRKLQMRKIELSITSPKCCCSFNGFHEQCPNQIEMNRIKLNQIEWVVSSEKPLCHRFTYIWWCWPLCYFSFFSQIVDILGNKMNLLYFVAATVSERLRANKKILNAQTCLRLFVHICVVVYWTRRPFQSGWTCFEFSLFWLFIHSFFSLSSAISSIHEVPFLGMAT